MIKVSIIIPVYKVEKYIERCLRSVMAQTYDGPVECILVDDCTPDRSMEIARQILSAYSGNIDFKMLRHEENRGLSVARNTGIREAAGEYLYFLDSDDEITPDAMEIFVRYLQKYGKPDFLTGNYVITGRFNSHPLKSPVILEKRADILKSYMAGEWYMMAWGKLINRRFFIVNNLWFAPGRLHEDELFSFQLALSASKMITVQEYVYKYIIRSDSITGAKKEKNYLDMFWIIQRKTDLIKQNTALFKDNSCSLYVISMLFGYIISVSTSNLPYQKKCVLLKWVQKQLSLSEYTYTTEKTIILKRFILFRSPCLVFKVCKLIHTFYS